MQLRDFLSYEEIYIQCHDSPDADALASGYGLYTYFQNHGIKTHLIYTGRFRIRKTNLVLMVEKLNIPVEYVEEGTLRLTDELLLILQNLPHIRIKSVLRHIPEYLYFVILVSLS